MRKKKGKIAYILGGSGLIGKEILKKISLYMSKVIILDIKKPNINSINNVKFIRFDCSDYKNLDKRILKIIKENGIPKIFINTSYPVSKNWKNCDFKKIKFNYFQENLNLHLSSYCWISKVFADQMKKMKSSSIILISSIYGIIAQDPKLYKGTNLNENMVYPIIKAGIISHCRQLAVNYANYGIKVNSVSPGGIEGKIKGKNQVQSIKFKKKYLSKVPMARFCEPKDIAELCIFLTSEKNSYITGQNIIIDGGLTII